MTAKPPFTITSHILSLSQDINRKLGLLEGLRIQPTPIKLRKDNQIKTIQSTLSIEGNSLELDQVQSILDGKIILAPEKDIIEVKNAIDLYENINTLNPLSLQSFKHAHKTLMISLIPQCGKFRDKGVGIFKGTEVSHVSPPAKMVPKLMKDLFDFIKKETDLSWLIKACVFHYELEFIHPFSDGNGRMGRLWQQLILMKEDPIFEFISVESLIKKSQERYYHVLAECDSEAESTKFIEYSLAQILEALDEYVQTVSGKPMDPDDRIRFAKTKLNESWFSRKDYITLHKNISSATASRDLLRGIEARLLEKSGEKNKTKYRFIA